MAGNTLKNLSRIYILFIFAFLYIPIIIIVVYSFNLSKNNAVWTGFTIDWYDKLVNDDNVLSAVKNSLIIAFLSTMVSSIIGTISAIGLHKYKFKGKSAVNLLLLIPIVIPEIVMGIALLLYFSILQINFGIVTLVLSHTTFCIPFVLINVKARLADFDSSIEEAAMDLGANDFIVFKSITMPIILPSVISGGMLAFALSLDDIIINFFVSGPESTTLPIKIFSMLRFGLSGEINALCTIMLIITFLVLIISQTIKVSLKK